MTLNRNTTFNPQRAYALGGEYDDGTAWAFWETITKADLPAVFDGLETSRSRRSKRHAGDLRGFLSGWADELDRGLTLGQIRSLALGRGMPR